MDRHISRIIGGRRYDTMTATEICLYESGEFPGDFDFEVTGLYRTPRGRFFLAGHGGARSRWSRPVQGGCAGGEGLMPIGHRAAREFAEHNADEATVAKYFAVEEA
ncbi:hypothetical protein [Rhizobium leguminosarum]|uniref:hypothetical protein n=1 Tax=Rhizobium leguminosarum TaxID=384 RepID=UPI003F9C089C